MKGALPKNIVINYTGDREDVYVEGDDTRLSQLFINLAINARDALPNGGNVGVDLVRVIFDDESCQDRAGLTPGEFARLSISDNGTGMPPQVKERIFEPFFTTKSNQGTGLGLATVVSIVEGHQGYIEVESQVGSGTLFCVYLPTTAPQSEQLARDLAGPAKNPSPEKTLGKERILVVDDEEVVRTVIQRSLEHFGYEVDVALDGADAVSRYRHDPSKYSLVILDMMMPKMAGDEVYHRLSQIDQNVRVLLVSGYSSEGRAQAVLEAGALSFIQKPFAVEDLAREVRKCLDRNVPAVGKSSVIVRDDDDQK